MPPKRTKLTVQKTKSDDEESSQSETENKFHRKTQQNLEPQEEPQEELQESQDEDQDEGQDDVHSPTEDEFPEQEHTGGRRGGGVNRGGRSDRGGRRPPLKKRPASSLDFNYTEILEKYKELANLPFEELVKYAIAKTFTEKKFGFCSRLKTMLQEMNGEIERPPFIPSAFRGGRSAFGRYNRYRGGRLG